MSSPPLSLLLLTPKPPLALCSLSLDPAISSQNPKPFDSSLDSTWLADDRSRRRSHRVLSSKSATVAIEGQATNRPPLFDGTNYNFWKIKMRIFLQCIDLDILDVVEDKFVVPARPYKDADRVLMALNVKAMNALHCSLSRDEFNRVSMCATAHEIWKTLETSHEETSQVKDSKINRLMIEYERFCMIANDSINSMYSRFNRIITELFNYGKKIIEKDMCLKILRSLPEEWQPKVNAIEEASDLDKLTLEDLIEKLKTYEMRLVDFRTKAKEEGPQKKKSLALKARKVVQEDSGSESEWSGNEEDIAAFVKNFNKMMKFRSFLKTGNY